MPSQYVKRYYPAVSDLLNLNSLDNTPLAFIKNALQSVFNKLFYKDLQTSRSANGDTGFYKMSIVSNSQIAFTIPGTEVSLIINKDGQDPDISSFPLSVEYSWKALAMIRSLTSQDVPAIIEDFLNLAIEIFQIDDKTMLYEAITGYIDYNSSSNGYAQAAAKLNTKFSTNITAPSSTSQAPLDDLLAEIKTKVLTQQNISLIETLFQVYIQGANSNQSWENISTFFRRIIGKEVKDELIKYITPHVKISLTITGNLAVPRKWLVPLDANDNPLPVTSASNAAVEEPRASFKFSKVDLILDSQTGANIQADFSISLSDPVMVGKSGMIIRSFQNLKLDLRSDKNIPEIAADGRSDSFKGIYLEQCEIEFPKNWQFSSSSLSATAPKIIAKKLIVGNEDGVSGIFSVEGAKREKYIPFVVSNPSNNLSQFLINGSQHTIAVTGDDTSNKYSLSYEAGEDFYIRDFSNNYYHFTNLGILSKVTNSIPSAILKYGFPNGMSISLDSFYLNLRHNRVIESAVVGSINRSGYQPVRITVEFEDGFLVKAYIPSGTPLLNNNNVEIKLDGLEFGKVNDEWQFGIAGSVKAKKLPPVVDKFLPQYFHLYRLFYKQSTGFEFDLEAGWSNGTIIRGDDKGGISGYIPINLAAENNGLLLKGINVKAKTNPNAEIEALLVGAGLKIGPVSGAVDDFGAKLVVRGSSEAEANFGGTKTEISIVGPSGIFVEIKTKVIEGSGYLHISDEEYVGALSLTLNTKKFKIGISAVGIITVKMPDGGKGTAVLALLCVTFNPGIPLIWGFQLQGVGGLVGIHHTINTDALRSGVREGTLDSILFPVIDVKNYSKVVNDMKTVFPIQRNQFIIGVMAKIVWPSVSPKLFIDFGLMVEMSEPVRLAIVGKLALRLGDDSSSSSSGASKLIRINVAFVGIIDFDAKYMSFDASIYDSQIAFLTLSGDMAMRLFWGDHKEFVLSVGGFHPAYDVPAYLKLPANMKRITIGLINGKIGPVEMRLTLDTYFAVSTNTLQFGAKLDMYIKFWKLEIIGKFGFDVLFQFKPFRFVSKVYAMLAVLFKGSEILSIGMDVNLVGPGPWHADGSATFKVLCFKKTCNFEKTWGDTPQVPAQPPLAIKPLIVQDVDKPENWTAQLPDSSKSHVQIKPAAQGVLMMDPLGNLSITQRTAPLGVDLFKSGETRLSDPGRYNISEVVVNSGMPGSVTYNSGSNAALFGEMREDFAPTQFKDMNDAEKLKAKSFEYLRSGVTISAGSLYTDGYFGREIKYDMVIVDDEYVDYTKKNIQFPRFFVNALVKGGLISANAVSVSKKLDVATPMVAVTQAEHKLVASDTLQDVQVTAATLSAKTYAEAFDLQQNLALNKLTELVYA